MSLPDPYSFLSIVYQNNSTEQHALLSKTLMKIRKSNSNLGFCVFCNNTHNLKSMHQNYEDNGKDENYSNMLLACFNIEVICSDGKDTEGDICACCVSRLRDACSFRRLIESVGELLQESCLVNENESQVIKQNIEQTKLTISPIKISLKPERKKRKGKRKKILWSDTDDDRERANNKSSNLESTSAPSVQSDDDFYWNEQIKEEEEKKTCSKADEDKMKIPSLDPSATKCPMCEKKFKLHYYLKKHFVSHYKKFLCDICGHASKSDGGLRFHLSMHSSAKFPCHVCNKIFKTKSVLSTHVKRVHNKFVPILRCTICGEQFKNYYLRSQHLISEHGFDKRTFPCDLCGKVYSKSLLLQQHFKNIHQKIKNHKCSQCNKNFFSKTHLKNHMIAHTDVKNFYCETCGKSYARKKTLTEHMKIHANIRAHKCEYCDKTFVQKCSLKGHLKTHINVRREVSSS